MTVIRCNRGLVRRAAAAHYRGDGAGGHGAGGDGRLKYPKLTFDAGRHPDLADNVWHAQMAGHPKVLTYAGPDLKLRKATRSDALHFEHGGERYAIPRVLSRDEYPFACTLEGGGASWVGHIPGRENSAQGGLIAGFLARHGIAAGNGEGSRFLVEVIGHRRGDVTNPCLPPCKGCEGGCRFTQGGDARTLGAPA